MSASRIEGAMTRINAAMARIDAARTQIDDAHAAQLEEIAAANADMPGEEAQDGAASARVIALVDAHEKLREEVAETIGQIDSLIEELEE